MANFVTGNYFDVLGVAALRGRTFLPDEGRTPGTSPVAVLSHRAWQRLFGGDPTAPWAARLSSTVTHSPSSA